MMTSAAVANDHGGFPITLWSAQAPLVDLRYSLSASSSSASPSFTQKWLPIPEPLLPAAWQSFVSDDALILHFSTTHAVVSSAVLHGGFQRLQHLINLRVSPECCIGLASPTSIFDEYLTRYHCAFPQLPTVLSSHSVGMMTAASMGSCRAATTTIDADTVGQIQLSVVVTTGIGNLRSAGDLAEYREIYSVPEKVGTINIALMSSLPLADAAMVEAITIATEAKAAVLHRLGLVSPISHLPATGTGTDAIICVSPLADKAQPCIDFVGKHTVIGEYIAKLVMTAINDSIISDTSLQTDGIHTVMPTNKSDIDE